MVIPIVAMAIFMGVLPNVFLHPMEASVNRVIQRITDRQPARVQALPRTPGTRETAQRAAGQP
jgi:NADH:ubiquinone oxidoreductase subunit 4 (subunit M)